MFIPYDLWLSIFDLVDPLDVLRLGQTCRTYHRLVSQSGVWIGILRNISIKEGYFLPSYLITEMSISQLQRASLYPHLFRQTLSSSSAGGANELVLSARSTSILRPGCHWKDLSDWATVYLVPGGRFLVTYANWQYFLTVWDLGPPGGLFDPPKTRAQIDLSQTLGKAQEYMTATSMDVCSVDQKLRIGLLVNRSDTWRVVVFEAYLDVETSAIKQQGTLELHPESTSYVRAEWKIAVRADRVYAWLDKADWQHSLVIWDYTTMRARKWMLDFQITEPVTFKPIVTNDVLVCFHEDGIRVWRVPTLDRSTKIQQNRPLPRDEVPQVPLKIPYPSVKPAGSMARPILFAPSDCSLLTANDPLFFNMIWPNLEDDDSGGLEGSASSTTWTCRLEVTSGSLSLTSRAEDEEGEGTIRPLEASLTIHRQCESPSTFPGALKYEHFVDVKADSSGHVSVALPMSVPIIVTVPGYSDVPATSRETTVDYLALWTLHPALRRTTVDGEQGEKLERMEPGGSQSEAKVNKFLPMGRLQSPATVSLCHLSGRMVYLVSSCDTLSSSATIEVFSFID